MLKNFKAIFPISQFQKVGSYNGLAMGIKMLTGLVVSKFSAILLGPSGVALLENLRNLTNTTFQLSSLGLDKGITANTAALKDDKQKLNSLLIVLWWLAVFSSLVFGFCVWYLANFLSNYILGTTDYDYIFKILAIILPLHILNIFLTSILKGKEKYIQVIHIQIVGHFLNLGLFLSFMYFKGLEGAFLALILLPSCMLFVSLWLAREERFFVPFWRLPDEIKNKLNNLGQYSLMAMFASALFAFVYIEVRNHIILSIGEDEAGWWSGVNRISNYYILFFVGLINLILLPKLAKSDSNKETTKVLVDFYKQLIPALVGVLLLVFLGKKYVVWLTLSKEFLPSTSLFLGQVIGDFFRILALVLAYQFHAKKMTIPFILTDLFLGLSIYFSSIYLINLLGLEGVVWAHSISYIAYFLVVLFYFRKLFLYPVLRQLSK